VMVLEQIALRSLVTGIFGTAGLGALMLARRVVELVAGATSAALGRASLIGLARDAVGSAGRQRTLLQAMGLGLALAVPVALLMALAGGPAVLWLAGPDWRESVPLIELSAMLVLVLPINAVLAQWHYSHDRAGLELGLRLLGTGMLLAFLPLALVMGLSGVVLAMALRAWSMAGLRLWLIFLRPGAVASLAPERIRSACRPRA